MALKLILHDDVADSCELASLRPYPAVVSTDSSLGVTPVVGPDGKTTYDLSASVANGPFVITSSRTGWWSGWSPIYTTNFGNIYLNNGAWANVGPSVTSPNVVTDLNYDAFLGSWYVASRRMLTYMWVEHRLLVNGAAVQTYTYDKYRYREWREDTNPNVVPPGVYHLEDGGVVNGSRLNIPANAAVQVQSRVLWRGVGAQSSAFARAIVGLRSRTSYTFIPRRLLVGV